MGTGVIAKGLSDNRPLPSLGFGCSPYRDGTAVDLGTAVEWALATGYRLFDTAELYGNERQIGEILRRPSSPPRRGLCRVSKVWRTNHRYDHVIGACAASLERLAITELDLYLVHSPQPWCHDMMLGDISRLSVEEARARAFPLQDDGRPALADVPIAETWSAMEELVRRGWVRAIGVSNFGQSQLEELVRVADVLPAVHQIERNPYRPQQRLIKYCKQHGIAVMAHSPLSAAGLLAEPVLREVGDTHGKSPAQILLRWNLEDGVVSLPSSLDRCHIVQNLDIFEFGLDATDVAAIRTLEKRGGEGPTSRETSGVAPR